jgi:hypothetical protein
MTQVEQIKSLAPTSLKKSIERTADALRAIESLCNKGLVPGAWLDQLTNLQQELGRESDRRRNVPTRKT